MIILSFITALLSHENMTLSGCSLILKYPHGRIIVEEATPMVFMLYFASVFDIFCFWANKIFFYFDCTAAVLAAI
jgi:hypothetical protein